MTISNELIQHILIGAAIASAIYWKLGWLRFPSQSPVSPPPVPPVFGQSPAPTPDAPSYKSMSNIPFEVAITPQNQVK